MYKRILVPIDGSHTANEGLNEAIKLARNHKSVLRLLFIVDQAILMSYPEAAMYTADFLQAMEDEGRDVLARAKTAVRRHGLRVDTVLDKGLASIADVIVHEAKKWKAEIIVLGTHGRRGVKRWVMGSDAELVVRAAPVPVLLVRSKTTPRARAKRRAKK